MMECRIAGIFQDLIRFRLNFHPTKKAILYLTPSSIAFISSCILCIAVKIGFQERDYVSDEGANVNVCILAVGQVQRTLDFELQTEALLPILRGICSLSLKLRIINTLRFLLSVCPSVCDGCGRAWPYKLQLISMV